MPLGVEVRSRTAPPSRGFATDTGRLFVADEVSAGPTDKAQLLRSVADFEAAFGVDRTSDAATWDYLDAYFREGGKQAYAARYVAGQPDDGLALFGPELGPGQVVLPGETPGAPTDTLLLQHGVDNNRVALLDVANGSTVAQMTTLGGAVPATNQDYGAVFGPWVTIPPPSGLIGGSERQVPASAVIAALIARADALGNPNRAAAGRDFPLQYATGFVTDLTMDQRSALLDAGVNTFADRYGVLQNYGFQTAVDQSSNTPFWQFNCARARMWLRARASVAGEGYMFKSIDGRGRLARAFASDLDAICLQLYAVDGLFGETPEDAFSTEVDEAVNSESTIAQGELNAVVEARLSLHAKRVLIDLVSVPVTGSVTPAA